MLRNVYVVGPTFGFDQVLPEYGYTAFTDRTVQGNEDKIEIISFMGGVDVNPKLYGQPMSRFTQHPNNARDMTEVALYHKYKHLPKFGICRGAQLLNVLNGGSMYQHVDGHAGANHEVIDVKGRRPIICSVHHQLMKPAPNSMLVAWAEGVSSRRFEVDDPVPHDGIDPEVLWIEEDKALLFQSHPEFGPTSCTDYFFNLVDEYIQKEAA